MTITKPRAVLPGPDSKHGSTGKLVAKQVLGVLTWGAAASLLLVLPAVGPLVAQPVSTASSSPTSTHTKATAAPSKTARHRFPPEVNDLGDWSAAYSYDGVGNPVVIGTNYYVYDALSRLTKGTA